MKQKDIFLDFTPLLDVTLIILFFFILFSSMEVAEAKFDLAAQKAEIQDTRQQLDGQVSQYEQLNRQSQWKLEQLQQDLEILAQEDPRGAANAKAMMEFHRNANMKLILSSDSGAPLLQVLCGEKLCGSIEVSDALGERLRQVMEQAGYTPEDTVFCEFILDGSQPGTAYAYRQVHRALSDLHGDYRYFYISETDISIGKSNGIKSRG